MLEILRFLTFLILAALALPVPAHAQTTGRNPSHEDILRGFDVSALHADKESGRTSFGTGATMTGVIHKWTKPIVYRMEGLLYDKKKNAYILEQLNRLAGMAGVDVKEAAPNGADVNFRIVIRDADLRVGGAPAGCYASSFFDPWSGIYLRAELHINLNYGPDISRCVIHEMLHALGLSGHPHKLHSVLSYYTLRTVFDLTEADEVMLRTLYDPRLKPGTSRLAALILADGIIEEKRRALNTGAPPRTAPDPVLQGVVADLEAEAGRGNVRAMLHLAEAHRFGLFLPQDEAKMLGLLEQGAAATNAAQRFNLAYALATGYHVPKDPARAHALYRQGAEQGHDVSQNNLGAQLRFGSGAAVDKIEALKWFILAARTETFQLAQRNRDSLAKELDEAERAEAEARAKAWKPQP